MKKLVIAIDGPAASGKSSTSKLVAKRLGYLYIDTGAMYRVLTLKILNDRVDPADEAKVILLAKRSSIRLEQKNHQLYVFLDDEDVTRAIRSEAVTKNVSAVSAISEVREVMVREQRLMARHGGVVLEGRDIGTVVFPDADLKIFMIADIEDRAYRRQKDLEREGAKVTVEELIKQIKERDKKDSRRSVSPLRKAHDAIILDTSDLTIKEQVEFIVKRAKEILKHQ